MNKNITKPFWKNKNLKDLTNDEWESLCDGCARCCLLKSEDTNTGEIAYTKIACKLLDSNACQCRNYRNRHKIIPDCIALNAENIKNLHWMPSTCAYRLISEGKDLAWWHPLVSGDPDTVFLAGISVRGRTIPEGEGQDPGENIIDWVK
tara:strand:+ start:104 stop:550 length:447 start_codon:yes stop_codon:yes gene_type:complete